MAFKFDDNELNYLRTERGGADLGRTLSNLASSSKAQDNKNFLENIIGGIGEKINDIGSTLNNIGKTVVGGITENSKKKETKDIMAKSKAKYNEIAKKYGYASYADASNDENASQDFWDEIRNVANDTTQKLENKSEREKNSYGNVRDVDLNQAKGQALSTIGTVLDFAPGFGVVGNIASGAIEGVGDAYKNAAGGGQVDLKDALARAAAGGLGAAAGGAVAGKLGAGKTILGQAGKSALSGAASGATSGGIMAAANGGNFLEGAYEGAKAGAAGGAVMGGGSAVIGKVGNNIANKVDNARTKAVNKGAVDRLADGIEYGADGNIKFTRLDKNLFDDINKVREANGYEPLTKRQVTAYKNAVNNNLGNRVQEGLTPRQVAEIAYNSLTNSDAEAFMGKGSNQLVTAPYNDKKYSGTVIDRYDGDGGTSLKSIEPRDASAVNRMRAEKNDQLGQLGSPLAANQERGVVYNDTARAGDVNIPLADQRPGLIGTPQGTLTESIPQAQPEVNSKTSTSAKLRRSAAKDLMGQYGTIDKATARSANAADSIQRVADAGFTKPQDVEGIIGKITGRDGKVTKLTRSLAASADNVNTRDLDTIIDNAIVSNMLDEKQAKAVRKNIDAKLNSLESRKQGNLAIADNGSDVLDVIKALEKDSAQAKGKYGKNYATTTPEREAQARVLDAVKDELEGRLWGNADVTKVLTPEIATELKSYSPNNKQWANYVDNTIMASRNGAELRSAVAPFVQMGKIIDNADLNAMTYGGRVGNYTNKLSAKGIANEVIDRTVNSPTAKRASAKAKEFFADRLDKMPLKGVGGKVGDAISGANSLEGIDSGVAGYLAGKNTIESPLQGRLATATLNGIANDVTALDVINPNIRNGVSNLSTALQQNIGGGENINSLINIGNRMEARGIAQNQVNDAERAKFEQEAGDTINNAVNEYGAGVLNYATMPENLNETQQAILSNAVNNIPQTAQEYTQSPQYTISQSSSTSMLDRISRAAEMALNAGDLTSYATLLDLYKQALSIYGGDEAKTAKTTAKNLTASQSKALTGMQQLETLAQMTPDAGTAVANSPLGFIVNMTGGNEYANQAKSLATTIGYLLSGATIKPDEAEAIGMSYVPNAFDSEEIRKQKLARARDLLQNYVGTTESLAQ